MDAFQKDSLMTATNFPEANTRYGPPPDLDANQCGTIFAYVGEVRRGSVEGARQVITAWQPDERERAAIAAGSPVFLSCLGGLPPHFLTTNFAEANNPA